MSILVVEHDDRGSCIVANLKADGHQVHLASDEITARLVAWNQKLDAVLVFLRPDGATSELAQDLRSHALAATVPLVAIDPGGLPPEASDTHAFDVFLQEPVDLAQLSGLLHHLCWQRQPRT